MVEGFELLEKTTFSSGIIHDYKFNVNDNTYYSSFIIDVDSRITISWYYYKDPEYQSEAILSSKELDEKIKKSILKQKEFRLRHLMKPYIFK